MCCGDPIKLTDKKLCGEETGLLEPSERTLYVLLVAMDVLIESAVGVSNRVHCAHVVYGI